MVAPFFRFFRHLHTVFHSGCIWWWCSNCLEKWCRTSSVQMNISSWSSHRLRPLTYSSVWTEEPGGLQSMESQRVRLDWDTDTYLFQWCSHYLNYSAEGLFHSQRHCLSIWTVDFSKDLGWCLWTYTAGGGYPVNDPLHIHSPLYLMQRRGKGEAKGNATHSSILAWRFPWSV